MIISQGGRTKSITINRLCKLMGLEKGDELEVKNIDKLNKNSKQFTIIVSSRKDGVNDGQNNNIRTKKHEQ